MAKGKQPSRSQRWADAVSDAQSALSRIDGAYDDLEVALSMLRDVQQEYQREAREFAARQVRDG